MRRADIQTIEVSAWGDKLASQIISGHVDAEFVIRVLQPYATEQRCARLQGVFARRIGSVTVVLDNICDPHNGAALLRTCEALGVGAVHLIEYGATFLAHAGVARGTHKWVQVHSHDSVAACVKTLKEQQFTLVATHPEGTLVPEQLASLDRVALVLGNEHQGIGTELSRACDNSVKVPMRGFAESLNVSVCGGILLAFATQGRPGDLTLDHQRRLFARGLAVSVPHAKELLQRALQRELHDGQRSPSNPGDPAGA